MAVSTVSADISIMVMVAMVTLPTAMRSNSLLTCRSNLKEASQPRQSILGQTRKGTLEARGTGNMRVHAPL